MLIILVYYAFCIPLSRIQFSINQADKYKTLKKIVTSYRNGVGLACILQFVSINLTNKISCVL